MPHEEPPSDCWVDVFESDYFMGRRRRLKGPQKLRKLQAKSLIVGPKATVVISVYHDNRPSIIKLNANRLVPDLNKSTGAAILSDVVVESLE